MNVDGWMGWIVIAVVLFIIELVTPGTFYFFCLGIGAGFAAVTTVFGSRLLNWIVFLVVSTVMVIISRPIIKKFGKVKTREANTDALSGKKGIVTHVVDGSGSGIVRVEGEDWRARSGKVIEKGKAVRVIRPEGNFLVVEETGE